MWQLARIDCKDFKFPFRTLLIKNQKRAFLLVVTSVFLQRPRQACPETRIFLETLLLSLATFIVLQTWRLFLLKQDYFCDFLNTEETTVRLLMSSVCVKFIFRMLGNYGIISFLFFDGFGFNENFNILTNSFMSALLFQCMNSTVIWKWSVYC